VCSPAHQDHEDLTSALPSSFNKKRHKIRKYF